MNWPAIMSPVLVFIIAISLGCAHTEGYQAVDESGHGCVTLLSGPTVRKSVVGQIMKEMLNFVAEENSWTKSSLLC
jgi:hypothetical protein